MKTSYRGSFVITWSQTEVDGLTGAPVSAIRIGTTWRWTGKPTRVDAPRDILLLEGAVDSIELQRRAAKNASKILGPAHAIDELVDEYESDQRLFEAGFDLTDGRERFHVTLVKLEHASRPMLLFVGAVPPSDQDLWVVHCETESLISDRSDQSGRGVICFVPGTCIATPDGPKLVQDLIEGDRISTKDNGDQEIRWIGERQVSGARLYAMPHLRPVRLRANILGQGEPDEDLLVSPDHRIVVKGEIAQALFNTSEVLVTARDMINDSSIVIDHSIREVTYIHMMLDQHQVLWANGVESESFHPAGARLDQIDSVQCKRLYERFPDIADDPYCYGEYARRNLTASEAAILAYDGLGKH